MSAPRASFSSPVADHVEAARLARLDLDRRRRSRGGTISCSRIALPAARASGEASAASSSARSEARDPRAAATSACSDAVRVPPPSRSGVGACSSRRGPRSDDRHCGGRGRRGGRRRGGRSSRRGPRSTIGPRARRGRRGAVGPVVAVAVGRSSRGVGAGNGVAAAASRFGAAPPSADRGRGHDPGGLGAHAEDAPAARGEDLEVEVVEPGTEGFARLAQRLFDGLAGELAIFAHVSVVSLVGSGVRGVPGGSSCQPMISCRHPSGSPHVCSDQVVVAFARGSAGCGLGRTPASSRGSGTSRPSPTIRYCWMIEKSVATIQ